MKRERKGEVVEQRDGVVEISWVGKFAFAIRKVHVAPTEFGSLQSGVTVGSHRMSFVRSGYEGQRSVQEPHSALSAYLYHPVTFGLGE